MKKASLPFLWLFFLVSHPSMLQGGDKVEFKINESNKTRVKFIYFALVNTHEYHSHNLGNNTKNKVYTKKDGHKEAVYDRTGKLVTTCLNKGNYNYFPAHTRPLMHFSKDILPWIKHGNCPNDPSSKKERLKAFSKDFTDGCFRVVSNWQAFAKEKDINKSSIQGKEQIETLKVFLRILTSKEFKKYKFDGSDPWIKDQKQYNIFYALLKKKIVEEFIK